MDRWLMCMMNEGMNEWMNEWWTACGPHS
jgi:hypothetical protein